MSNAIKHRGFKIENDHNVLAIYYPDGLKSNLAPGSVIAAKRIIDNHVKGLIRERNFKRTA